MHNFIKSTSLVTNQKPEGQWKIQRVSFPGNYLPQSQTALYLRVSSKELAFSPHASRLSKHPPGAERSKKQNKLYYSKASLHGSQQQTMALLVTYYFQRDRFIMSQMTSFLHAFCWPCPLQYFPVSFTDALCQQGCTHYLRGSLLPRFQHIH